MYLEDNVDVAGTPTQHGTDAFVAGPGTSTTTGGSIRIPASVNGLVGLRPIRRRLHRLPAAIAAIGAGWPGATQGMVSHRRLGPRGAPAGARLRRGGSTPVRPHPGVG
ncbi:amidase family protein [uncultured Nocardioides sp.]|uniref:amidase family protein n=1 Tax=uncultured Nocardioides sp. TaxID=198441 RepID=UPI0025E3F946|nr:amidase family protein [uncultured Nocardioides sp.]